MVLNAIRMCFINVSIKMNYWKFLFIIIILPGLTNAWFSELVADYWPTQCEIKPNYRSDIDFDLGRYVKGQSIAVTHARWSVESHFKEDQPRHALTIVLAGTTGTGKNFVSSLISEAILPKEFIHIYAGRNAFPDESKIEEYRKQLVSDVTKHVLRCKFSIFIFDEIDKMPEQLLDSIKPFLDFHPHVNHVDYRRATFFFLTNIGGLELNTQYIALREQGIVREKMVYSHFEHILRRVLFNENGLMKQSQVISDHLVSFYIPFLPLEKSHVKECISQEFSDNAMYLDDTKMNRVLENIDFNKNGISKSGCKRVSNFVAMEKVREKYEL